MVTSLYMIYYSYYQYVSVVDREGSEMISKLTGKQKVLAATTDNKDVRPSQKALNKNQDGNDR